MAEPEAAPSLDLQKLWEDRSGLPDFKMRDELYKIHTNAYKSRTSDGEKQNVTWRPIMLDGQVGDTRGREPINMTKQIGLHHTATSAKPPRTWNEPGAEESEETADKNTALIQAVFRDSRIKLIQAKQSNHLAVLGDACYGLEYDQDKDAERKMWIRSVDPIYAYPGIDDMDPARLQDILISYEVRKGWAEKAYQTSIRSDRSTVRIFEYWDCDWRIVQIEKQRIEKFDLHHDLDFVPWYWCFNQVPGMYGQADVAETPKLQGTMNELMILALDAMRKNIDKAYYAIGYKGTISPQAGKAIGFPSPNVQIGEFPTAAPPAMITELMQYIQANAQSMAGISPISMEGMAQGSIVTGSAVRHQVEAIEARSETKRTNLEACFGWIGESVLKIYGAKFPDQETMLRVGEQKVGHKGSEVGSWTHCEATYGGADGLPQSERMNWALQGLGRVHGRRTAIALTYPERDVMSIEREIDADHLHQATMAAQAQAQAAQVLQSGQEAGPQGQAAPADTTSPSGPAPTPPQVPETPPAPGRALMGGRASTISDIRLLIRLVPNLKGDVYAVGELAITGFAVVPDIAVTRDDDQASVQAAVQARRGVVRVGVSEEEPKVQLND